MATEYPIRPSVSSVAFFRPQILHATTNRAPRTTAPPIPTTTPITVFRVLVDIPVVEVLSGSAAEPVDEEDELALVMVYELVLPLTVVTTTVTLGGVVVPGGVVVVWAADEVVLDVELPSGEEELVVELVLGGGVWDADEEDVVEIEEELWLAELLEDVVEDLSLPVVVESDPESSLSVSASEVSSALPSRDQPAVTCERASRTASSRNC